MTDTHDILFDPENARDHPIRNREMLRESLQKVGGFRSIAIDGENIIRAGNGVWSEAQDLGFTLRIVDAAPNEIIGVRRPDLVGDDAKLAALYDNRTAETSAWNLDTLEQLAESLGILETTDLWTPDEWAILLDPDSLSDEPVGYMLPDADDEEQGPAKMSGRGSVALDDRPTDDEKYPVSLILTRQEYELWVQMRAKIGSSLGRPVRDKEAFLILLTGEHPSA